MSMSGFLRVDEAEPRLAALNVVDVRTPGEFASGHVPGAVNVPLERFESSLATLRSAAVTGPLLLVCASGARSEKGVAVLASHGITAAGLTGGTRAWAAAGHRLAHPPGPVRAVWGMERQVRFTAGALVLLGLVLGLLAHPAFQLLSAGIAGGLVFSALTDTCGMAVVLGRLPLNRRPVSPEGRSGSGTG
ncbi:rhodanese-like domain-containing protein [Streptomyces roseofulvus]|uniref:Rhodanese-like domain-containing protein n=2 Tax=Streptomyces TaxID=1883 RepID=A0ABU4KIE9_9ACTN|nr:rhodanese-like domain-containing protein [Streptomyces roseolus]MDX2297492.1 rhodanese-like domain-containing protein [Streptomyces roseolus]